MTEKKEKRFPLAFRLGLLILGAATILRIITMWLTYENSRDVILRLAQEKLTYVAWATANEIEGYLRAVQATAETTAAILETRDVPPGELEQLLQNDAQRNNFIYGATAAFEPRAYDPSVEYYGLYLHETAGPGSPVAAMRIAPPSYDYMSQEWYRQPKLLGKHVWSEPYIDPGVHRLMSTCSVPVMKDTGGGKKFIGVITVDVTIDNMVNLIKKIHLYRSGHAFLVSKKGLLITHPDPNNIMRESIFSFAEKLNEPKLRDAGLRMIRGEPGFVQINRYNGWDRSWVFYVPVETGWTVAVAIPESELYEELNQLTEKYVFISAIMLALLFLVIIFVLQRVTAPLKVLAGKTREIAKGNLDVEIPPARTRDEVKDLSTAFESMRVSLKDYIRNLESTTAAKSRFESELKIAQNIQMSFLPRTFPPFPDREEFELHAFLKPAKEVGGDLYDFFFAENGNLYFLVGDVSDKGVPAALFMAATTTLMRGFSHHGESPAEVLSRVNRELCLYNEAMMFVTLFCGALNLKTGELAYSNAGHNPPLMVRNGVPAYLKLNPGFVLGVDEKFVYQEERLFLKPGDLFIVYSDGITEAMNSENKVFSEERLSETVGKCCDRPTVEIVEDVKTAVHEHVKDCAQSDDLTLLALRYSGPAS